MKPIIFAWLAIILIACSHGSSAAKDKKSVKDISLDQIVESPDRFQDPVRVKGVIVKSRNAKNIFMLGCEDACYFMPVQYKGLLPAVKCKVRVYGSIRKQQDGRYIFQATEIKDQ